MFDPFGDFETAGYLRNVERLRNPEDVKQLEDALFKANIGNALQYLKDIQGEVLYEHFLEVHRILFADFYPWAGQDRQMLGVGQLVGKGEELQFESAELCKRAVSWGLEMGNDIGQMRLHPGTVMGAFAWGHPFLDGNGRTMLLVHAELCCRAGVIIHWHRTSKSRYLEALSRELLEPAGRHLDRYLEPFMESGSQRSSMLERLVTINGLDGLDGLNDDDDLNVAYDDGDPVARQRYLNIARRHHRRKMP